MIRLAVSGNILCDKYNRKSLYLNMASKVFFGGFCKSLPFLTTLTKLMKEADINNQINFPKVVVLGSQGAGKSSVIEYLLGLDFLPKNSEITMIRPLELKLVYSYDAIPFAVFDEVDGKIFDFSKVKNIIIGLNKESAIDHNKTIFYPIVLTIYSNSCPDLTIVELPAVKRILSGVTQGNMNTLLEEPKWEYVENPQNIILSVIPINVNTNIIELLSLKANQLWNRTLAILTKIDLIDDHEMVESMLLDDTVKIKYGFIAVFSERNPNGLKAQTFYDEKMFFPANEFSTKKSSKNFGIDNLVKRVSDIIYQHIKLLFPAIRKVAVKRLRKCEERIKFLEDRPTKDINSKYQHLWILVTEFCELLKNTIYGKYEKQYNLRISRQLAAGATIKSVYNSILGDYLGDYKASKAYTDEYIIKIIQEYEGDNIPGFYSIDAFIELVQPLIINLKTPIIDCLMEVYGYLECLIEGIISKIFSIFPTVSFEVSKVALEVLKSCFITTQELIENILKAGENYIFTNDIDSLIFPHENLNLKNSPSAVLSFQLRTRIDNYFKIIINNYRDSIPKIIGCFLVRNSIEKMQKALFESIGNSEAVANSIIEPEYIIKERKELKTQINSLNRLLKALRYDKEFEERVNCFNRWLEERENRYKRQINQNSKENFITHENFKDAENI